MLVAAGAYLGQDLRDPDGLARPLLRRAALRFTAQRSAALKRIGEVYLRADPPTVDELPATPDPVALLEAPAEPDRAESDRFGAPGQP